MMKMFNVLFISKVKDKHFDCYMFFQFDPLFGNYNVTLIGS